MGTLDDITSTSNVAEAPVLVTVLIAEIYNVLHVFLLLKTRYLARYAFGV